MLPGHKNRVADVDVDAILEVKMPSGTPMESEAKEGLCLRTAIRAGVVASRKIEV